MKSTSTPTTNKFPKMLGQGVVASFEVEQSITTGNQAPRLRHATHHLCTRPTSPPQLSLSLFLSTETKPLFDPHPAHIHTLLLTFTFASSCDQSPLCPINLLLIHLGMPPFQKSAVFLNIVQKAFDPPPLLFEHLSYFAGGVF